VNKDTQEAISWVGLWGFLAFLVFNVTTCATHLNTLNTQETLCKQILEANRDGKEQQDVCNIRPPHWSYEYTPEVEERVLLPERPRRGDDTVLEPSGEEQGRSESSWGFRDWYREPSLYPTAKWYHSLDPRQSRPEDNEGHTQ